MHTSGMLLCHSDCILTASWMWQDEGDCGSLPVLPVEGVPLALLVDGPAPPLPAPAM